LQFARATAFTFYCLQLFDLFEGKVTTFSAIWFYYSQYYAYYIEYRV